MKKITTLLATVAAAALIAGCGANADETPHAVPASTTMDAPASGEQTAVLSGGCFWGLQGVFEHVKGVKRVVSGYAGGAANTAQYETVSGGNTGHAETVQIKYDPKQVSYADLLRVYFSVATDPTELNRQGPDEGTQYRGDIWTTTPDQARVAKAYIAQLSASHTFSAPIVTRVDAFKGFYPAEDYHQDYLVLNPDSAYIQINDLPKIEALKRVWPDFYRARPVLLAQR